MLDATHLIEGASVIAALAIIGGIIFAESGLLVGFFLPGDTLLFTAGFFASQGQLPLGGVFLAIFVGAIIGDNVGYTIGAKLGPRLFKKKDGLIFRHSYIEQSKAFYQKHGGKTMMFARFVPIIRTFAPMIAGVAHMPRKRFVMYDMLGAAFWTVSVVMLGYWLGSLVDPHVMEKFLVGIILLAMLITFGPTMYHLVRNQRLRTFIKNKLKK